MNILLNSLLSIYAGDEGICDMFRQVDMSQMNYKFNSELLARMSVEEVNEVQSWLQSDIVKRYNEAVYGATMACSRDLSDLIRFLQDGNAEMKRLN